MWDFDYFQCILVTRIFLHRVKNADHALVSDHLWMTNIYKETLRRVKIYIKNENSEIRVVSPRQLYAMLSAIFMCQFLS